MSGYGECVVGCQEACDFSGLVLQLVAQKIHNNKSKKVDSEHATADVGQWSSVRRLQVQGARGAGVMHGANSSINVQQT